MRKAFLLFIFFISIQNLLAANSLSYSGRLVQINGAPVTGPVNLRAELVYTNATSTILCFQDLTSVALTKGVFHLKLDLNCTPKTITQILSETPNGESVAIRIIDQSNSKTYPLQAIHSVPYSKVAEQLPQMGASSGQALTWDGAKWAPTTVGSGNGSVTTINTGAGLTGGPISTSGTISVAAGGITATELAANSVTAAKINAGEITSTHISATAAIPYSKLSIGVGEIPQDRINGLSTSMSALIEDVIVDAVTGKAPSQNAVYDALGLKADRTNVAQSITAASVVGLTAPTVGSAAANRDYVDNSATTLDTRITNEVATLNTTLGTKYDKSGGVIAGDVTLNTQMLLKGGANFVTVKANSGTANYTMTLPTSAGTSGYVLQTDGTGVLSWVNPSSVVTGTGTVNSASITDGSIVDADVNASANIAQSKISNLTTDLASKQPLITAGTTAQYYRGDKTFVDLGTDVRATTLTGFTTGANSTVLSTDSTLSAFGKVQGQINATNTAVAGKEPAITAGTTAQYIRGDKTLSTFATDAINSVLSSFSVGTGTKPSVTNTDSVVGAFGKVQKTLNDINADYVSKTANQTINGSLAINSATGFITVPTPINPNDAANKSYVDSFGQWLENGSNIYFNTGKVGIGTNTPASHLHINTGISSTDYTGIKLENPFVTWTLGNNLPNSYNNNFSIYEGTNSRLWIASGGNVGIGSNNPGAKLEVAGQVKITGGTPGNGKVLTSDATGLASWATITGDNLGNHNATQNINLGVYKLVGNGGTNGISIDASGNVDFGTSVGVKIGPNSTTGSSWGSLAGGFSSTASSISTFAFGTNVTASNWYAFASGEGTTASGRSSVAMGEDITVSGANSIGFGLAQNGTPPVVSNPNTMAIMGGNVGIGTVSPASKLHVSGGEVQLGSSGAGCSATNEGAQRYNSTSKQMEFCNGTSWGSIGGSGTAPVASIETMMTATCPTGYLTANGAAVSRTTYAALFTAIGVMYGAGDGSTTFNLPDLRGYFLRGVSAGSGSDPDAASRTNRGDGTTGDAVGTKQVDQFKSHTHGHDGYFVSSYNIHDGDVDGSTVATGYDKTTISGSITASGGTESRPKNINVLYCIKH